MLDSFIDSFFIYYGADWASMITGFAAAWMITSKNRWGFVLMIISLILAVVTAVIAHQYGFIVANIINIGIAIRGWVLWSNERGEASIIEDVVDKNSTQTS